MKTCALHLGVALFMVAVGYLTIYSEAYKGGSDALARLGVLMVFGGLVWAIGAFVVLLVLLGRNLVGRSAPAQPD
ncbi:MAG: hypothetical protein WDN08_03005 [Rhizomicrobium sp.]